jgi:hypothetical protein
MMRRTLDGHHLGGAVHRSHCGAFIAAALLAVAAVTGCTETGGGTTSPPPPVDPGNGGGPSGSCGQGSFTAEAVATGGRWTATRAGRPLYSGASMREAVQAAVNGLDAGRSAKQWVVVRGSGSVAANERISLPSYTGIDVCGAITVTGSATGDYAPLYARNAHDVEVRNASVRGTPAYGLFFRSVANLVLGTIDVRVSSGLGVRIDNFHDKAVPTRNTRIDNVYVSGTSDQGVETYGLDGVQIGTVTARNLKGSGLLLNQTVNVTVGTVDAEGAGTGTGYAAFRMANRNGRVGSAYPTNIKVGTVRARGGGRGVFCVSESGGAQIDHVDIAGTGSNAILIENCHNVNIAAVSGTVTGGGEIRLAARDEFAPSSGITLQNLAVADTTVRWSPCSGTGNVVRNVTRTNAPLAWC